MSSRWISTLSIDRVFFYAIICANHFFIMSEEFTRIANALERIAGALEHLHIEKIDHAHIDDIGEIHGDVVTHPKQF